MKFKLITTLTVLLLFTSSLYAQKDSSPLDQLFQLPDETDRWDFGLTFQALGGIRQVQSAGIGYDSDEIWIGLSAGLYADYKINKVWNLRAEAGLNAYVGLDPYMNFQSEFTFTKRWSFYAGAGAYMNTIANDLVSRDESGKVILNPYVQVGLRYKMSKNWTMDLRYQQDLFARQRATDFNRFTKQGSMGSFALGFNYRF